MLPDYRKKFKIRDLTVDIIRGKGTLWRHGDDVIPVRRRVPAMVENESESGQGKRVKFSDLLGEVVAVSIFR